ncbi:TrfA protein [Paraburkholderia phenazinium]|uniref:TrfA protein n=1 Tax=Paraburkholderia phenazinium TaxID=60549 RepID=A0A1G7YIG5_9BURK|nr:plasmid replication initiator TrfA [Paraburkholderia phenazinium]SDG96025.1 TrfA protein [Paraburkholderia phenazinium]
MSRPVFPHRSNVLTRTANPEPAVVVPLRGPSGATKTKGASRENVLTVAPIVTSGVVVNDSQVSTTRPWPNDERMTPNAIARSALFGCLVKRESDDLDSPGVVGKERVLGDFIIRTVMAQDPYLIDYIGPRLNQTDSEVWQACVITCRNAGARMGDRVMIKLNDLCKMLGRQTDSGATNRIITASLERLHSGKLRVKRMPRKDGIQVDQDQRFANARIVCRGNLLKRFDEIGVGRDRRYFIAFDEAIMPLFESDMTLLDLRRKAGLDSALAKWCHDYYSTHSDPIPMSLEKLRTLSGSDHMLPKNFRAKMIRAIGELVACGLFAPSTAIKDGMLHVTKASQSRLKPYEEPGRAIDVAPTDRKPNPKPEEGDTRSAAEKTAARQRSKVAL